MQVSEETILEIKLTLGLFAENCKRYEKDWEEQEDVIKELQAQVRRLESRVDRTVSSNDRYQLQVADIESYFRDTLSLRQWQETANNRMNYLSKAVITGIVGMVFAGITTVGAFYITGHQQASPPPLVREKK